jgi:hypothetical protein
METRARKRLRAAEPALLTALLDQNVEGDTVSRKPDSRPTKRARPSKAIRSGLEPSRGLHSLPSELLLAIIRAIPCVKSWVDGDGWEGVPVTDETGPRGDWKRGEYWWKSSVAGKGLKFWLEQRRMWLEVVGLRLVCSKLCVTKGYGCEEWLTWMLRAVR